MEGLYFRTLAPSTSVIDAGVGNITSRETKQLLIAKMNVLQVWQASSDDDDELTVVEEAVVHERIEHARIIGGMDCAKQKGEGSADSPLDMLLLITSDHAIQIVQWDPRSATFGALSTVQAAAPNASPGSPPALPCMAGSILSDQHEMVKRGKATQLFAAALYEGFLHVISVTEGGEDGAMAVDGVQERGPPELRVQLTECQQLSEASRGLRKKEEMFSVRSLAFMPKINGVDQEGNPLLVVLHENTGYMDQAVHLQCLSVSLDTGSLLAGPWMVRNVHPSTNLLKTLNPASPQDAPGVVAFSSIGCQLYTSEQPSITLSLELQGLPRAAEEVFPGGWLMSDSSGTLWYLVLSGDTWHGKPASLKQCQGDGDTDMADGSEEPGAGETRGITGKALRTPVAEVLRTIPCPSSDGRRLVFIGSHQGSSQLLRSPALQEYETAARTALGCLASSWEVLEPAFVDNLAPINDVMMFEHPPGSGEKHLALCCGGAPTGRLVVASIAAERSVLAEAGGFLTGVPTLHSTRVEVPGGGLQSHLALSFDAPEHTEVMALDNGCLTQCSLQGLDSASSTLLFTAVPGGWVVQVTLKEVRVLGHSPSCSLHDSWEAPARLSLASSRGGHLLIAAGSKLHALIVEEETGKVLQVQSAEWTRQLSAIAQVGVKLSGGGGREFRVSAIGSWEDNRVTLCRSGELTALPLGHAELPHGQARAIAVAEFGGIETQLVVGTSAGLVVVYRLADATEMSDASSPSSAPAALSLIPALQVWAGSSPVQLSSLKHPETGQEMVYANSSQDLLLHQAEGGQGQNTPQTRVCTLRVTAESMAASLVPLPADQDGDCTVVWADTRGHLIVGAIEPEARLRHRTCDLADTPVAASYHKESHCCMLICSDANNCATLRLVHADTLQQVALVRMEPGHQPCDIAALPLPCSSVEKAKADAFPAILDTEKEFLVVSSCLIQKAVAGGGLHTAVGVLSAFEVICKPGEGFDHYEVVLHASQQIPNIAHCLSGIRVPDASLGSAPVEPQGGDARSQAMQPAVLLGTEDSLLLVQLFIDDLALRSVEAVQSVMKALELSSAAPVLPHPAAEDTSSPQEGHHGEGLENANGGNGNQPKEVHVLNAGGAPPPPPEDRWEVWRQRMKVEVLSKCKSYTGGSIASISTRGDSVLAHEFLGSAAIYKVAVDGTPSLTRVAADNSPIFSPSGCYLGDNLYLFSTQPYGFLLLGQDMASQEKFEALVRAHAAKIREAGQRRRRAQESSPQQGRAPSESNPQQQLQELPDLADTPVLQPMGLCRKPQLVVKFCLGRLGIPHSADLGADGAHEGSQSTKDAAVYVTSCGMVGSVQLVSKDEITALERLQMAIHLASVSNNGKGAPWTATKHQHADMWNWSLSEMMAAGRDIAEEDGMDMFGDSLPAACVDGDLFRLFKSAGHESAEFAGRTKAMYEDANASDGGGGSEADVQISWEEALDLAWTIEHRSIET